MVRSLVRSGSSSSPSGSKRRIRTEPGWQGIEIPRREQIAPEHSGVNQRVNVGLCDRSTLEGETSLSLFPRNEWLQLAERSRCTGLIGAEQVGDLERTGQGIDLPSLVAAGIHRSNDGTHTTTDDQIGPDAQAVEYPKYSDMGQAFCPTTGEYQGGTLGTTGLGSAGRCREQGGG
jgi:hypothetical protein